MQLSNGSPWGLTPRTLTDNPGGAFTSEGVQANPTTPAIQNIFSAYQTVVAALAHSAQSVVFCSAANANKNYRLEIAVGPAAAEVPFFTLFLPGTGGFPQLGGLCVPVSRLAMPKGSRVSVRIANDSDGVSITFFVGIVIMEFND